MKTAAKVFIIIGMVVMASFIFPIILGIFSLQALDNATSQKDLTTWGIITLLFVSLLGGIFMLCIKDEELAGNVAKFNYVTKTANHTATQNFTSTENYQTDESIDIINDEIFDEL